MVPRTAARLPSFSCRTSGGYGLSALPKVCSVAMVRKSLLAAKRVSAHAAYLTRRVRVSPCHTPAASSRSGPSAQSCVSSPMIPSISPSTCSSGRSGQFSSSAACFMYRSRASWKKVPVSSALKSKVSRLTGRSP